MRKGSTMSSIPGSIEPTADAEVRRGDVCIVGAGAAGMNALFVASQYLRRDQKIILIDSRERVGGMWVDVYPYVRLHQPHGMFTAGNIPWTLGKDRGYLATKNEVLDHFEHCLDTIEQRVRVDKLFGWTLVSDEEAGDVVRVTCRSADGQTLVVEAKRLIKAYGFRVTPNDPLQISSGRVRSVSPDFCDMRGGSIGAGNDPVWIIGGGKSAMDTAHALITDYPGREVNLVAGSGTFFQSRDRFFPAGARRWWDGELMSVFARNLARRFDGTNEEEVWNWHRAENGIWLTPYTGNFLVGLLSEAEKETIATGLNDVFMDHFVDAVDDNDDTRVVFRSGATARIRPGSWIVNCTGYVLRRNYPYEPYSSGGAVMSIQNRSAVTFMSTLTSYFLTHLMFQDKLTNTPLYELDAPDLISKSKKALPYALLTLTQYNLSLLLDSLPISAFRDCGMDLDRWYPLPRRIAAMSQLALTHRRDRDHLRRSLDVVRERFEVRCGPLANAMPTSSLP